MSKANHRKTESQHTLVIGLGRFGRSIVDTLFEARAQVTTLDRDERAAGSVKDKADATYVGDATEDEVLATVGLDQVDTAIVAIGDDFEVSVLAVTILAQAKVERIIARASTERQAQILRKVGATQVMQLEREMGQRLATDLAGPVAADLIEFAQGYRVVPWSASGPLVGKTLPEADLRRAYGLNVIGYRPREEHTPQGRKPHLRVPGPEYAIREDDTLLLVGDEEHIAHFMETQD